MESNRELTFIAHRSRDGMSFMPENSFLAYKDAINNPLVGGIEIDIQRTKDGVFVLMNYQNLENVTYLVDEEKIGIQDYTYDELFQMYFHANLKEVENTIITQAKEFGENAGKMLEYYKRLKSNPEMVKIATLRDILSLERNGKPLFIEIKTNYSKVEKSLSKAYAKDLVDLLKKYNTTNLYIIGRDTNTLECIKEENPELLCMPVIGYDDVEKVTYGFDGAAIAENHLLKKVPHNNKLAWEYILENGQIVSVWNLRTYESFKRIIGIFDNIDFKPTSDFAALIHQNYLDDENKKKTLL